MKQIEQEELKIGKKYWVEATVNDYVLGDKLPLCLSIEDYGHLWLSEAFPVYLPDEGKVEESPRYVKNIIKKLRDLDEHNRMVWLNRIMDEFGEELRQSWYHNGYEQGKVEGSLECGKAKLTKEQAEIFEKAKKENHYIYDFLDEFPYGDDELYDRAYLNGYEIIKEPLYWVRKRNGNSLLEKDFQGTIAEMGGWSIEHQIENIDRFAFTEKEIKDYDERYWAFAVPVEETE